MTKTELIDRVASAMGGSKTEALRALEGVSRAVSEALQQGEDKIPLPELGTFHAKKSPPRQGRNPMTGQAITIAGRTRVSFKLTKSLKDALGDDEDKDQDEG